MSQGDTKQEIQCPPRLAWWTLNVYLVCLFLGLWLGLTMWGAFAASDSPMSTSRFLRVAQWVPLSYLVLVVTYGIIMNRIGAKYAANANANAEDSRAGLGSGSDKRPIAVAEDV
jgi:uncharacterized membrane protein